MDSSSILSAMSAFDIFLCTAQIDLSSILVKLSSSEYAKIVANRQLWLLVEAYKRLFDEIMDEKNKYDKPLTLLLRSVSDVETLLVVSVDDYDFV
ncbi:hypothetical protein HK096_004417 [Nowakowskiella sp. JEL0078]|nr:hypothetical protein HK096_004417 [Nowakowskiella sp. JEL0078]